MFDMSNVDESSILDDDGYSAWGVDVFSSSGYHTFAKNKLYSQENIEIIYQQFKKYRDRTKEIVIEGPIRYGVDPKGKHYFIFYKKQKKGLIWKIRFSNNGIWIDDEYLTCSVKAIINPKMMVGEKSYIKAANVECLEEIEKVFNEEAEKISPMLGKYHQYSLNRVDYCINFDLSEVEIDGPLELREKFAHYMMRLISYGDIPNSFERKYKNENQFYLKSKSVVINCYWKYADLIENYPQCKDLEKSKDIIRFEIQFKYPKVYSEVKKFKEVQKQRSITLQKKLDELSFFELNENDEKHEEYIRIMREIRECSTSEIKKLKYMLSDEKCAETIDEYFNRTIGKGNYYTYKVAERKIEAEFSSWEKIMRLKKTLKIIYECGGIRNVKDTLQGKELDDFRRSLRELEGIRINPVIIPEEWGIKYIPNLLGNYYDLQGKKRRKKELEEFMKQEAENYMKDCKKRGVDWMKQNEFN